MPHAFEIVLFVGLRLAEAFVFLGLEESDFPLQGLEEPLQLGDGKAELEYGFLMEDVSALISRLARRRISSFNTTAMLGTVC